MITLGWAGLQRHKATILFAFFILLHTVTSSAAMQLPTGILAKLPEISSIDKSTIIDFGKKFFADTLDLNYMTAQELVIKLPASSQNLVIDWGFGGSGYMLSAMPWVPVTIRASKDQAEASFNLAQLGKALAADKVTKEAKSVSMLKWFTDQQLSPLKLCSLKLFLLAKDFKQNVIGQQQVQTELLRLLVRLSLTDNLGVIDAQKPFSSCMPEMLQDLVERYMPGSLATLDYLLSMLIVEKSDNQATFISKLPRTVHACTFTSQTAADLYFQSLKHYPATNFIDGSDIVIFDGVTATHTPANMPAELKDAALAVTHLPELIKVHSNGQHWIGCVTDRLGLTSTALLSASALLATVKEYTLIRQAYLAQHPKKALKLKQAQQAKQLEKRRIYAFGKTEAGIASQARLDQQLEAIKGAPIENKEQINFAQAQEALQKLELEIAVLREKEAALTQRLAIIEQSIKNAPITTKLSLQKRKAALIKDLDTLANTLHKKETKLARKQASLPAEPVQIQATEEDVKNLEELVQLAAELRRNGEPVPNDVTALIEELEAKIKQADAEPVNTMPLDDRLVQRETIAQVYHSEAKLLEKEVAQRVAAIKVTAQASKRRIEEIKFNSLEKPLFDACIQNLQQKADMIIDQNTKMLDLHAYRQAVASMDSSTMPSEYKTEMQNLEYEVGLLLDNNGADFHYSTSSKAGLLQSLVYDNEEITHMLKDLSGDNKAYAHIKDVLFKSLGTIVQKSDHIKEFGSTYRYILQKSLPEFLPLFEHILNSPVANN